MQTASVNIFVAVMNNLSFWPQHLLVNGGGKVNSFAFVIGWNIHSFVVCIATCLENVTIEELDRILDGLKGGENDAIMHMEKECGVHPSIIGVIYGQGFDGQLPPQVISLRSKCDIWMEWKMDSEIPVIKNIFCFGYQYDSKQHEIVVYKQPSLMLMQYYTLQSTIFGQESSDISASSALMEAKLHYHGSQKRQESCGKGSQSVKKTTDIEYILQQINFSNELEQLINLELTKEDLSLSTSHLLDEAPNSVLRAWIVNPIAFLTSFIFRLLFHLVNIKILGHNLNQHSFSVQQYNIFYQRVSVWMQDFVKFKRSKLKNTSPIRSDYIWQVASSDAVPSNNFYSFYNIVWLTINDVLFGIVIGSFIMQNSGFISNYIIWFLKEFSIKTIEQMVLWLMGWPAGLKLNNNLDTFLGELFLWILSLWTVTMMQIIPHLPSIIFAVGCSGIFGVSMIISLFSDFAMFLGLHILLFYFVASKIFNWQLSIIVSLFHLFQGKKQNILRHRLDSTDYDVDQLLLGTILFTILVFLFPTVAVYYFLFAYNRALMAALNTSLQILLSLINNFPLFPLILRFKDPQRLPAGISYSLHITSTRRYYLRLSSKTAPLTAVFKKWTDIFKNMKNHYISKSFFAHIFLGSKFEYLPKQWVLPIDEYGNKEN